MLPCAHTIPENERTLSTVITTQMRLLFAVTIVLVSTAAPRAAQDAVQLRMRAWSTALGVECTHCHEAGDWAAATKPAHAMVEKMLPIFDEIPKHFDNSRRPLTQCYMCHQGQRIPERRPR